MFNPEGNIHNLLKELMVYENDLDSDYEFCIQTDRVPTEDEVWELMTRYPDFIHDFKIDDHTLLLSLAQPTSSRETLIELDDIMSTDFLYGAQDERLGELDERINTSLSILRAIKRAFA